MKVVATIEARMTSKRLPGKVLRELDGAPMLQRIIERAGRAGRVDQVILATTVNRTDDPLEDLARRLGAACHRGSEDDVLDRVLQAARSSGGDLIVELTGDSPFTDPSLIDDMVDFYRTGGYDYVANTAMRHSAQWEKDPTFPIGTSVEIFSADLLGKVAGWTQDPIDHEHVSSYIFERPDRFRLGAFEAEGKWERCRRPDVRLTVDTPEDLALAREVYARLHPRNPRFTLMDVIEVFEKEPELLAINGQVVQQRVFEQRQASA
ncbi:MAG: glycosyltransferase family protein [Candidatus Tectomicrobia bacterium]|uniref:Glycosyltransferase family protein n=1 Tax=Tectimicrobiota bacterium TaxID=2528274 RepID=A0A932HX35_UNCTE|nr:glycosyltransferase family protein [Candidatus Tectomicrobia bacterium]